MTSPTTSNNSRALTAYALSIDPWLLPRVLIKDRLTLPFKPALYFVFDFSDLLYIGATTDLRARIGNHHKQEIKSRLDLSVAYWLAPPFSRWGQIHEAEKLLIQTFQPRLNIAYY